MKTEKTVNWDKITFVVMMALVIASLVAGTGLGYWFWGNTDPLAAIGAQPVNRVFVDVDQDGQLDLLVSGSVIFNAPLAELTANQP